MVFLITFLIHSFSSDKYLTFRTDLDETEFGLSFFAALPLMFTSYGFQGAYFTAFASLKNKTNKNGIMTDIFSRISVYTIFTSTIIIAFGLYGNDIEKNLLKTFTKEKGILPAL